MTKQIVLKLLREHTEEFLSGEAISRQAGVSRAAVWKAVEQLRQEGYGIESVPNRGYRLTRVMMIVQDMGEQHLLQSLANTDGLTGLLNKRYFDRVLTVLEQHCQPFALFYMDLDRFKPVNDTYGHDVGDELLKGVAQRLQGCIRSRDYAFRLGGDEFALLLLGPMTQETCARKMDMICEMIADDACQNGITEEMKAAFTEAMTVLLRGLEAELDIHYQTRGDKI